MSPENSRHSDATQADKVVAGPLYRRDPDLAQGLYIVSTPIGNLRDITLRALDVLASADIVLAEDTRVARKLMQAYSLNPELRPYHDHNAAKARPAILKLLEEGRRIALISDAGTPLVSDPGFKLARKVIEAGHEVFAIPGASAALAGLTVSRLPSDKFLFAGFPPPRKSARRTFLTSFVGVEATLIFYEGPSRLAECLQDLLETLGDRDAVIARELTKKFEEARRAPLSALIDLVKEEGPPRGEIVLLVGPRKQGEVVAQETIDTDIRKALESLPVKAAATEIANRYGLKRRDVYNRALEIKDE